MLNNVVIAGNLARDPEVRAVGNTSVTSMTLAVSEKWKDQKSGEMKEKTAWVRISAWGKTGEIAAEASKGDTIVVNGSLETQSWEDKDGNKREQLQVNARSVYKVARSEAKGIAKGKSVDKGRPGSFEDEIPF